MWGHWSPRGQSPAAAYEQMGWSSGLVASVLLTSLSKEAKVHAGDELKSLSETKGEDR